MNKYYFSETTKGLFSDTWKHAAVLGGLLVLFGLMVLLHPMLLVTLIAGGFMCVGGVLLYLAYYAHK